VELRARVHVACGDDLESRNKHEDAALAYMAGGELQRAQHAYRQAGQWRMVLALAGVLCGVFGVAGVGRAPVHVYMFVGGGLRYTISNGLGRCTCMNMLCMYVNVSHSPMPISLESSRPPPRHAGRQVTPEPQMRSLASELVADLAGAARQAEAAQLTIEWLREGGGGGSAGAWCENAVVLLVGAREWREALRVAFAYGR
jgi:hypothetical protein